MGEQNRTTSSPTSATTNHSKVEPTSMPKSLSASTLLALRVEQTPAFTGAYPQSTPSASQDLEETSLQSKDGSCWNNVCCKTQSTSDQYAPKNVFRFWSVLEPDGSFLFYWLALVTTSVLYNLWTPIAREAFPELNEACPLAWMVADVACDVAYFGDVLVQFRTGYLERGLIVYSGRKLAKFDFSNLFSLFEMLMNLFASTKCDESLQHFGIETIS